MHNECPNELHYAIGIWYTFLDRQNPVDHVEKLVVEGLLPRQLDSMRNFFPDIRRSSMYFCKMNDVLFVRSH